MPDHDPIDTGWKIHSAIIDWTGKVDSKANFVLTIESALLAGVVALTGDHRRLSHLRSWRAQAGFWSGVAVLASGVLSVAWVVRPRLRSRKLKAEVPTNFIFFGHLRKWSAAELEVALRDRDLLPVLSRQLVNASQVAWFKHRALQFSMLCALAGTALVSLAAVWSRSR